MREWLWLTVLFVGVLLFGLAATVGFFWRQQHAALYRQKYEVEHKYRNLFESSCDALMTRGASFLEVHRRQPGNAGDVPVEERAGVGSPWAWELSPERQPDGRASGEKAKEMIEMAVREGSHFFEWTHKRIDGEEFPATVLLTRMKQAGKVVVQATVRDITEQKRAEERFGRAKPARGPSRELGPGRHPDDGPERPGFLLESSRRTHPRLHERPKPSARTCMNSLLHSVIMPRTMRHFPSFNALARVVP